MRTVLIPIICLLLGLAAGYAVTSATSKVEVTPAMIEQGIRENPRLVLDLLQQYPEELFEVVLTGQELRQKEARRERILAQLLDPVQVDYADDRPVRGNKDAPITIVEFSDFQCPHCAKSGLAVEKVVAASPDVKQVFLHYPLSSHEKAPIAAAFFEAAAMQDPQKAWELHDVIFENQEKLAEGGGAWLRETAASLGLDVEQLDTDLMGEEVRKRLQADAEAAQKLGIRGTPSYVIGGVVVSGAMPREDFEEILTMVRENRPAAPAAQSSQDAQAEAPADEQPAPEQTGGEEPPAPETTAPEGSAQQSAQ